MSIQKNDSDDVSGRSHLVAFKQAISRKIRSVYPELWQRIQYHRYFFDAGCEREFRIVHTFVDPSKAALDIGVFLGMYTRHLSRYAKNVIGFEANPELARFAKRSLHKVARIEWVALSSEQGMAVLRVPIHGTSGGEAGYGTISASNRLGGARYDEILVPTRTLDSFDLPPVGFIKIDVEGHEEAVLEGGKGMLSRDRPVYLIEIEERHSPGSLNRLVRLFEAEGYSALFYDGSALRPVAEFDHRTHQVFGSGIYINNFFFLPSECKKLADLFS
jgi:FkbM family methyltransferase